MTTTIEQELAAFTKQQLIARYPTGWGGIAGMRLADGTFITSISPDFPNAAFQCLHGTGRHARSRQS